MFNKGRGMIHSNLGVPDHTCWPSKRANQPEPRGQGPSTPWGCTEREPSHLAEPGHNLFQETSLKSHQAIDGKYDFLARFHIKGDICVASRAYKKLK